MIGRALGWLVRDVFLRARSTGFSAALLAGTLLTAIACASATFDGHSLNLLFGFIGIPGADMAEAARSLLYYVALGMVDFIGVPFVLIGSAGFLPSFVEPAAASVLLSKPPRRATMLVGRVLGAMSFVFVHAILFFAAVAVTVGIRTGAWSGFFWLALPMLLAQFFAYFGFASLIAVSTHSVVSTMLAGIFFWLISWGLGVGRHVLAAISVQGAAPKIDQLVDIVYAVLPKPVDFSLWLHGALGVAPEGLMAIGFKASNQQGLADPVFAVISTLLVGVAMFALAIYELEHQDY